MTAFSPYRWRQPRLQRGWDPMQMVGRMKLVAAREGVGLPKTWLLLRLVFLWENQRAPVPTVYAGLLTQVFDPSRWVPSPHLRHPGHVQGGSVTQAAGQTSHRPTGLRHPSTRDRQRSTAGRSGP